MADSFPIEKLPYCKPMRTWLAGRYGEEEASVIWEDVKVRYEGYLKDSPDLGGKKNGHAMAIFGGLLVFAFYRALPDHPPIGELSDFINMMFFGSFARAGKIIDLNRSADMRLIDCIFRKSGNRDRKDIVRYPDGFINVDEPYDRENRAARYHFTQCPNAEFAKGHDLLDVLPLLCNSDYYGISALHGKLIRCGTCGTGDVCDYCVVGDRSALASQYETITDENGFLRSRSV